MFDCSDNESDSSSDSGYTVTIGDGIYSYTINGITFKQDYEVYNWNSDYTGLDGIDNGNI